MRSKYRVAVEHGAAAYVYARPSGPVAVTAQSADAAVETPIPAVSLSQESVALIRRAALRSDVRLRVRTSSQRTDAVTANVVVRVPGRAPLPEIIVGAHLDSHDIAPGALDNGCGVAIVCELARLFARHAGRFPRPLRFVLFSGEELGRQGSRRFVEESIADPREVFLYYNFDLPVYGGFPILYTMTGTERPGFWLGLGEALGYPFPIQAVLSRSSDHFSFYQRGIPCIWQIAHKRGSRRPTGFDHTIHDTLDKVDPGELREAAMLAARLLLRLVHEERELFPPLRADPRGVRALR